MLVLISNAKPLRVIKMFKKNKVHVAICWTAPRHSQVEWHWSIHPVMQQSYFPCICAFSEM